MIWIEHHLKWLKMIFENLMHFRGLGTVFSFIIHSVLIKNNVFSLTLYFNAKINARRLPSNLNWLISWIVIFDIIKIILK